MCDGVRARRASPPREGTPLYVYSAATIAGALPRHRRGVRRLSARHPLRAEGELDAGDRAPAARPRQQRRRQFRRRDRRRAARRVHSGADRLHRRRQDHRPSSRRPSISASGPSTSSRRASSSASTRCRASGRRARDRPPRSTPTSTPGPIRTSRPASRPTSSASPLGDVTALCAARARRCAGVEIVGPARARRLADHRPRSADAAPRARSSTLARELRGDGTRIEHLDLGGGLGVSYDGSRGARPRSEYAGAVLPIVRESGLAIVLEPGRQIVAPAGALLTRVVDVKERPASRQARS